MDILHEPRAHRHPVIMHLGSMRMAALAAGLLVWLIAAGSSGADEIQWTATAGGNWNTATNWNPQNVPNQAGEAALIPADGFTYTVALNTSPSIDSLRIANPTATLSFGSGTTLTLLTGTGLDNRGIVGALTASGTLSGLVHNRSGAWIKMNGGRDLTLAVPDLFNEGTLIVNENASTNNSVLTFSSNALLRGPGELILRTAGTADDAVLTTGAGLVLTHASGHTIRGTGTITAALANSGWIVATETGRVLLLQTAAKSNDGIISATNSGYLDVANCVITQATGGRLAADGGLVRLNAGARITGGELASSGGGYLTCQASTPVLEDVRLTGELRVLTGRTLSLQGTEITNDGLLILNQELGTNNAVLRADSDLTLSGAGTCRLLQAGDPNDASLQTAAGVTLTQGAGHTIAGSGVILAQLVNEGVLRADDTAQLLRLTGNPKTNRGLIEAGEDATLQLTSLSLQQDPGATLRADGGTVQLGDDAHVTGGLLTTAGDGVIAATNGTSHLTGCEIEGTFQVYDGVVVALHAPGLTNDGTITVHANQSANNAFLDVDEAVTVAGAGEIVLNAVTGTNDAEITGTGVLTVGADQTVRGAGEIHVAVENLGHIRAEYPALPLVLTNANKINRATLGAVNGATLTISGIRVDQAAGGTLAPSDGLILLASGATVAGGTLSPTGTGAVRAGLGTAYLDGAVNQGRLEIEGGDAVEVVGAQLVNEGRILINYPANSLNSVLRFQSDATVSGLGEIVLQTLGVSNDAILDAYAGATVTIAPEQTVRGEGQITARVRNEGLITADAPGRALELVTQPKLNDGTLRAEGRGILSFASGTITNTGTVAAVDSGVVRASSATLENAGLVTAAAGGRLTVDGGAVVNSGLIRADAGGHVEQTGGIFTQAGTLQAQPDGEIVIDYGTFTNTGTVEALAGGSFWCDRLASHYSGGRLSQGTWVVRGDGEMRLIGAAVTTLNASVLLDGPQATIYRDNGTAEALANLATIEAGGRLELVDGRNFAAPGALANQSGTIVVGAGCAMTTGGAYTQTGYAPTSPQQAGQGWLIVNGTFTPPAGSTLSLQGGTLAGSGTVTADVSNAGRVDPGASVGTLTVNGNYTQAASGTLYLEIAGTGAGQYDHLAVTGQAVLSGRVWVRVNEGTTLQPGDVLTVMSFASSTGTFTERWGCAGVGLVYEVVVNPTNVQLVIYADVSGVEEGLDPIGQPEPGTGPDGGADPSEPHGALDPEAPGATGDAQRGGLDPQGPGVVPDALRFSAAAAPRGRVVFRLDLPEAALVQLEVFDFSGRVMDSWRAACAAGTHRYTWDGRMRDGSRAPAGVYFGRAAIRTAATTQTAAARALMMR